jgi:hypothetical protein
MGHDSERAAMTYLRGRGERQQAIADPLSQLATDELKRGSNRSAQVRRPRAGAPTSAGSTSGPGAAACWR